MKQLENLAAGAFLGALAATLQTSMETRGAVASPSTAVRAAGGARAFAARCCRTS